MPDEASTQIDYDTFPRSFNQPPIMAADANAPQHMQRTVYVMENYQSQRDKHKKRANSAPDRRNNLHLTHGGGAKD